MSAAGGLEKVFQRAEALEATALQLFTKQPQRWADPDLTSTEVDLFRQARQASSVEVVVVHDSYLINLASPKPDLWEKSRNAFEAELRRSARLGVDWVVSHPGNATDGDVRAGLRRNARGIARAFEAVPEGPGLLLETTAGSGTALGSTFEELLVLIDLLGKEASSRVGVCLDTAHVLAAGYDLKHMPNEVLDEFDEVLGLERLELFHCNDSQHPRASHKDRHEHLGQGHVGRKSFEALLTHPQLLEVPAIIETPKGERGEAEVLDRKNLSRLRDWTN